MVYRNDQNQMTPEERFQEAAAILAAGYLRLKQSQVYRESLAFTDKALDFFANQSVHEC